MAASAAPVQLSLVDLLLTEGEAAELQRLLAELERKYERHAHILKRGTIDPFWHDSMNLNLVRSHILAAKRAITALCESKGIPVPEAVNRPTPPEYPPEFCVVCRPHHS
jgi:hypothetical protein